MDYLKFAADNARREFQPENTATNLSAVNRQFPKYTLGSNYGCTICQVHHYQTDALYNEHMMSQDKHGIQIDPVYAAYLKGEQPDPRD